MIDLPRTIIEARLRQGYTQRQLAEAWEISETVLSQVRHGKSPPTRNLLKHMGIVEHSVYLYGGQETPLPELPRGRRRTLAQRCSVPKPVDDLALPNTPRASHLPDPRPETQARVVPAPRSSEDAPIPTRESVLESFPLTTERIRVAVRFKLNPTQTRMEFIASGCVPTDAAWLVFCESIGTPAKVNPAPALAVSLGNGDALILKEIAPRQDFRTPQAFSVGNRQGVTGWPPLVSSDPMPEVTASPQS